MNLAVFAGGLQAVEKNFLEGVGKTCAVATQRDGWQIGFDFQPGGAAGKSAGLGEAGLQNLVERGELGVGLVGTGEQQHLIGEPLDALGFAGEGVLERVAKFGVVDLRIEELLVRGERAQASCGSRARSGGRSG